MRMKLLVFVVSCALSSFAMRIETPRSSAIMADSTICEVTVFKDRAQVMRKAQVKLRAGKNLIQIEGLPERIDQNSIQVSGAGKALINDVQFKTQRFNEIPDANRKELYAKQQELQDYKAELDDREDLLKESGKFVGAIAKKVTFTAKDESVLELDPEKWQQMINLHRTEIADHQAGLRKLKIEQRQLTIDLGKVSSEIREAGYSQRKVKRLIEVELEAESAGAVTLSVAYLVYGPSWSPSYDIRADKQARTLELSYYGQVRQSTGEDWSNVALILSTSNPSLGGAHPDLSPWRIKPVRLGSARNTKKKSAMKPSMMQNFIAAEPSSSFSFDEEDASLSKMAMRDAVANTAGASVVFEVAGESSIVSDNVQHRVAISKESVATRFRYSLVPKLSTTAYLKAKAVNSLDYPFLAGNANIYLDGSYVTSTQTKLITPSEAFWTFLGADESVKVKYNKLSQKDTYEGMRGKTLRKHFDYEIELTNGTGCSEEFVIWDQLPISEDEGIKVVLVEPKLSESVIKTNLDYIEWIKTLDAGQMVKMPFRFYVESESGTNIEGIK